LVGSQQPEQLRTRKRHHEIALDVHSQNIHSELGETTIATLSPALEAFCGLLFTKLSSPGIGPGGLQEISGDNMSIHSGKR